ncbi:MAG: cytochrome C [Planctomycetaceae bacterium]|nr:cytochrome C [Planctomycetaceae bacterium]
MRPGSTPSVALLVCVVSACGVNSRVVRADVDFFEKHIRPVFVEHCYECHSDKAGEPKAGLSLDRRSGWEQGGDSGPVLDLDNPEESLLLKAISYNDDFYQMPPEEKLSNEIVDHFREWIEMGAPAPEEEEDDDEEKSAAENREESVASLGKSHWAFQPPSLDIPAFEGELLHAHPIDRLIAVGLQEADLAPSQRATDETLVRRLHFDLTGLPPDYESMQQYLSSEDERKYEQLVEQLLQSPQFGERWARHWLDVARFADTKGYVFTQDRNYPDAHKYRDWVIDSFNRDRSIKEFLQFQLAADQLGNEQGSDLPAMGFLTLGRRFLNNQNDIIDDRIDVVTRGMMGLTVSCARCHDHKYDPIPTADYYSLYGVFDNSSEPGGDPSPLRMVDRKDLRDAHILLRGNASNRGEKVPRQFLQVLSPDDRRPFQEGSGRREMALAIAADENPLTARVFVNRVWGHLMGSHLVETPSDFGTRSNRPTQLPLLDYLTIRFIENDWSFKWLVREITGSSTYQQSVTHRTAAIERDPENRLYWRMNRRRLDFEAMRDSILKICNGLDLSEIGGPSDKITRVESRRRSLYAHLDRQNLPSLFRVFDVALPDTHVPKRFQTTVPQQALFLMNSPFIRHHSQGLASSREYETVEALYRQILARDPNPQEQALAEAFLTDGAHQSKEQTLAELAQVLLLSNEFIFLD